MAASPAGTVAILMNGPSSSGKSTLCRALQDHLAGLAGGQDAQAYARVAFDDVVPLMADRLFPHSLVRQQGGDPARLVYRPWRPGAPLAADACAIPAPTTAALEPGALGLLLVPALAFDPASGIRLGYGGGWYDRLRADPAWAAVPALVVLPAVCLAVALPRDGWDVPFRGWLDEHGLHGLQGPLAV